MKVKDIMTDRVVVATTAHKLSQALEFFANFSINHIPVVEGERVVGIISARDVIKKIYEEMLTNDLEFSLSDLDKHFTIKEVMTLAPTSVKSTDKVKDVAKIFNKHNFHALPVEEDNVLKGIVTTKDLAKALS